jgi:hypothetical protein
MGTTTSTKANAGLGPGVLCANTSKHEADHNANRARDKELSNIRAKLCLAGGQCLHIAEGGLFFVSNPFGHIKKFDTLASLQAHADRCAR